MRILKPLPGTLPMPGRPLSDAIGLWLMNSLGARIFDLMGNGNNGTLAGDAHFASGKFGHALSLDGNGDYAVIAYATNLDLLEGDQPLTFCSLSKSDITDYTGDASLFHQADDGGTGRAFLNIKTSTDKWRSYLGGALDSNIAVTLDWEFWSVLYTGTDLEIYKNAEFIISDTRSIDENARGVYYIGRHKQGAAGQFFNGLIDHILFSNRALYIGELALHDREPFSMFPENIMPEFGIAA